MTSSLLRFARTAAVACALAVTAVPALAQDFSASHMAAARAVIDAAKVDEPFDQILLVLSDQSKALFQRSNPSAVQDIDEVVNQVALDLAKRRPELDRELERIWAARFTEEELKTIAAFYTSDVGQKFGTHMRLVVQDSVRAAGIWRDTLSTEMVTRAREELAKRGHTF